MDDFYTEVAEFYDLVPRAFAAGGAALRSVLAEVDPRSGTAVDIGAGTGRTCRILAEGLPGTPILACEPAPGMRAVLTHDVLADDDLRDRVTISAEPAERLTLPESICVLVLFGVIGHLDADRRRALWDRVLPRLLPGAPVVVELLPMTSPAPLPAMTLTSERIGEHTYDAVLEGEPAGGDLMRLTSTWTVHGGAGPQRVVHNVSEWHTFGVEDLVRETGLAGRQLTDQVGVLRSPA